MDGIIFTSNTGTTEQYAKLLGEKTGLPVYPLAKSILPKGAEVIYLGWIMAGGVKGYKKAARIYTVKALCGVGMSTTGTHIEDVRKANEVNDNFPVFILQGGFDINNLHGMYRFMMKMMSKSLSQSLSEKEDKTEEDDIILNMLVNGGNQVNEGNLQVVLDWYSKLCIN